jgi:crotonobetainyl-CoA:carnitine CoA-transferase CaiB-like acyl-CoA transferase
MTESRQPLAGVNVLDVSGPIGAYATKLLADLGADVVLVEPPGGDALRRTPPFKDGVARTDTSLPFVYYHGGKRGTVLAVGDAASLPALRGLGARADVVVISPSPRAPLAGFDEHDGTISWARDDAIVCAVTPFGLTGPFRHRRATPFVSYAMGGDMHRYGPVEGPPVALPGRVVWDEAGAHAAIAVLSALLARDSTGGQLIDLSVHDVLCSKDFHFEQYHLVGKPPGGRTIGIGYPPTGTWSCKDGVVDVASHQTAHWDAFLATLGHPEALAAPALHDAVVRREIFDGLIDVIDGLFADEAREDFVDRGQSLGLPCAPVNTPTEFVADAQLAARNFFVDVVDPSLGEVRLPGRPVVTSADLFRPGRAAPCLGEHTGEPFAGDGTAEPADLANPLTGVRVLSFGAFVAGNTSALMLAELGADVVKIEAHARPEVLRMPAYAYGRVVEEPSGVTNTVLYAGLSRSTRNLSIDLQTEEGRDLFRRLVAESDVVIENFGSETTMAHWGCSFDELRAINPRIVVLSLSGYGRTGPRSFYRAYGTNISCFVGLTHTWGHTHGTLTDYLCSAHGVIGVLAGLAHAARTGHGTSVDAAQIETAAVSMAPMLLDALANGRDLAPEVNTVPGALLSGAYR